MSELLHGKLGDFIELNYGKSLPKRDRDGEGFPVVGSGGISGYHSEPLVEGPALVVGRKGSIGEVYLVEGGCSPIDTTYYVNEFGEGSVRYWYYLLRSLPLTEMNRATAIPGLNRNDAYDLDVAIAPPTRQGEVAARIDQKLKQLQGARERLNVLPSQIEKFRQSVLAAAFRGDLTKEWREQNPDVEPASELLERIRAERRERYIEDYAEQRRAKAEAKARKKGKPWTEADDQKALVKGRKKASQRYEAPEPVDSTEMPDLPEKWCWARLEDLTPPDAPIVYGIIQPGPHIPDGVPFIRPADISDSTVVESELPRTSTEISEKYQRAALKCGDLVYSIVGTIGKWVIIPPSLEGANITQSSVRLRPMRPISVSLLLRGLQSPQVQEQVQRLLFGNAVQRLNVGHVRELAVPLIPTAEWEMLEPQLEKAIAKSLDLAAIVDRQMDRLSSLEQSILAAAFQT